MKAIVLHAPHDVKVGELPTPAPEKDQIKVRVAYCGMCGSDFHKIEGKKNTHPVKYPVALGHEISGYVEEVGENVSGFAIGDAVTVDPNWSCGTCDFCQQGNPSFCRNARGVVKGMAEFVCAPASNVYHLPKGMDMKLAALTEPLSCCLHGMDLLDMKAGMRVALIGFGAIGTMMLRLLKQSGAGEILVFEPNLSKKDQAMAMGAQRFFASYEDAEEYLTTHNVDRVMECVGIGPAQNTALQVAGKGATVVMFGVSDSSKTLPISFYDAFTKELVIKTSFVNPHTTARAISLLASGVFDKDPVISAVLTMEQGQEEFLSPNFTKQGKVLVEIHP